MFFEYAEEEGKVYLVNFSQVENKITPNRVKEIKMDGPIYKGSHYGEEYYWGFISKDNVFPRVWLNFGHHYLINFYKQDILAELRIDHECSSPNEEFYLDYYTWDLLRQPREIVSNINGTLTTLEYKRMQRRTLFNDRPIFARKKSGN